MCQIRNPLVLLDDSPEQLDHIARLWDVRQPCVYGSIYAIGVTEDPHRQIQRRDGVYSRYTPDRGVYVADWSGRDGHTVTESLDAIRVASSV